MGGAQSRSRGDTSSDCMLRMTPSRTTCKSWPITCWKSCTGMTGFHTDARCCKRRAMRWSHVARRALHVAPGIAGLAPMHMHAACRRQGGATRLVPPTGSIGRARPALQPCTWCSARRAQERAEAPFRRTLCTVLADGDRAASERRRRAKRTSASARHWAAVAAARSATSSWWSSFETALCTSWLPSAVSVSAKLFAESSSSNICACEWCDFQQTNAYAHRQ